MVLKFFRFTAGVFLLLALGGFSLGALADTPAAAPAPTSNETSTTVYNKTVSRVSDCKSEAWGPGGNQTYREPLNCVYLEEPIGGRPNYDLFKVTCAKPVAPAAPAAPASPGASAPAAATPAAPVKGCNYELWGGEAITGDTHGPVQAILSFTPERRGEQGFTLLYSYVGLIYKYLSGIIVGMSVLFVIIGGVEITTSGGSEGLDKGKKRIIHALVGMVVWFLASLILYTINPTFFAY